MTKSNLIENHPVDTLQRAAAVLAVLAYAEAETPDNPECFGRYLMLAAVRSAIEHVIGQLEAAAKAKAA